MWYNCDMKSAQIGQRGKKIDKNVFKYPKGVLE